MTETPCPLDGAGMPQDRTVCSKCTGTLAGLLSDVPALMGDLMTARAKGARFTARVGSRSTSTPLPVDLAAADASWVASRTLLIWAEHVAAIRRHRLPETWAEVGDYLRRFAVPWLARHPDGPQAVDELTAAVRQARRAVDRPADRAYIGRCGALIEDADAAPVDCTQELYAIANRETTTCPRCGTEWNVQARQDAMLARMRAMTLPAVDLSRALVGLGRTVTPDVIRQWKRRGQLQPAADQHGRPRATADGRPLYRVGDVLDLAEQRFMSVVGGNVRP